MTRQPTDPAYDPRLRATLLELDTPTRVALVWRAVLHGAALRLVAWTAPREDVYLPAASRRP